MLLVADDRLAHSFRIRGQRYSLATIECGDELISAGIELA